MVRTVSASRSLPATNSPGAVAHDAPGAFSFYAGRGPIPLQAGRRPPVSSSPGGRQRSKPRRAAEPADPWTDAEILMALDLRDHEGRGYAEIGRYLDRSKNSVLSMLRRVDAETDAVDLSPHLNGTQPRGWWA